MPSNKYTWSFEIRVHTCPNCGAPCEITTGSGQAKCAYCGVSMTFRARDEPLAIRAPDVAITENERVERLREQVASMDPRWWPPSSVRQYFRTDTLGSCALAEEAAREWNEHRAQVEQGARGDVEIRLYWLTVAMRGFNSSDEHQWRCRAMSETVVELIEEPSAKARLFCYLASSAARADDLTAAWSWLSRVDPRSPDIGVHTSYALTLAFIALKEGKYADILVYVGKSRNEVPLHLSFADHACLLRAAAYECMGDVNAAVEALAETAGPLLNMVYGPKKLKLYMGHHRFEASCCQKSYAAYVSRVTKRKAIFWMMVAFLAGMVAMHVFR